MATNNLGVDNVKRVAAFLILTGVKIEETISDFNYGKALGLAFHVGENLDIVDAGKDALAELKDMNAAETQEVADFIGEDFDIANDELEARIEAGIQLIPEGYALLKANIAFYQKSSDYVKTWKKPNTAQAISMEQTLRRVDLPKLRRNLAA